MDFPNPRYTPAQRERLEELRSRRNVANAILAARISMGLSQEEVGRAAGTKQSRVSEVEAMKGNLRFDTLDRVARVLGLMVDLVPRRGPLSRYDEIAGFRQHYAASTGFAATTIVFAEHKVKVA